MNILFVVLFLKESDLIFCVQLNGLKYCYCLYTFSRNFVGLIKLPTKPKYEIFFPLHTVKLLYCCITLMILLNIYLYTVKWLQVLLFNTNNSIQYYSFICTQLNSSKYCYEISVNNKLFVCSQLNG